MLYILNYSPYLCDFAAILRTTSINDTLLLISDGVIAGLNNSLALNAINAYSLKIYALKNDIEARGIFPFYFPKIKIISYIEFVKLTENNFQQITW
ncbi:Protein TusB [Candidatus Mikella endobia]|uniref:Protein TusB n=1 Tax=Candidatus Mikella endobia TaxID=1778264 RepID=A0A143WSA3_9ENTR|nr:sulfurtransferase complex subunit TusB [Candidatus Mikella endobia]CUX95769.1 Protein TusB [Candidatus Mikella endobia]